MSNNKNYGQIEDDYDEIKEEDINLKSRFDNNSLSLEVRNWDCQDINSILNGYKKFFEIVLNYEVQRNKVWNKEKKNRLID